MVLDETRIFSGIWKSPQADGAVLAWCLVGKVSVMETLG